MHTRIAPPPAHAHALWNEDPTVAPSGMATVTNEPSGHSTSISIPGSPPSGTTTSNAVTFAKVIGTSAIARREKNQYHVRAREWGARGSAGVGAPRAIFVALCSRCGGGANVRCGKGVVAKVNCKLGWPRT